MRIDFSNFNIWKNRSTNHKTPIQSYQTSPFVFKGRGYDSFQRTNNSQTDSTKSFQIKNIKNLHCPACGLIMLDDEQINQFIQDVATARGTELVEALEKYEDERAISGEKTDNPKTIYRPQKQEIVNIIKELARQYPEEDISGLVRIEGKNHIDKLIASQLEIVGKLEEYIKSSQLDLTEKATLRYIIDEHKARIKGESDIEFQNKPFVYAILNATDNKGVKSQIANIVSKLPNSDSQIDSFFVKYEKKNRSAKEIAKKFVAQSVPSADHLIPKSKKGANSIKNYLCDCSDCNSKRSNTPFYEWQKTIPDFEKNLEEHIKEIRAAQEKGIIDTTYDSYISDLTKTIEKLSLGEIVLDIKPVVDERAHAKEMAKRKQEIAKISKTIKSLEKQKRQVRAKIIEFESYPQFQNYLQYQAAKLQIDELKQRISALGDDKLEKEENLNKRLERLERKKELLEAIIRPDEDVDYELEEQKLLLEAMKETHENASSLKRRLNKKHELAEKEVQITQQLQNAKNENLKIKSNPFFDVENEENITAYYHLKDLYQAADEILTRQGRYKRKNITSVERELYQISKKSLVDNISQLLTRDDVRYFLNLENIEHFELQLAGIRNELNKLSDCTQETYEKASQEYMDIAQGKTIPEVEAYIEELEKKQRFMHSEDDISELRKKDQELKDTIVYYKNIKTKLKNYRNMSKEDFIKYSSLASR